jgi:hypothetical protein
LSFQHIKSFTDADAHLYTAHPVSSCLSFLDMAARAIDQCALRWQPGEMLHLVLVMTW